MNIRFARDSSKTKFGAKFRAKKYAVSGSIETAHFAYWSSLFKLRYIIPGL
jgi:hypothetical protein